MLTAPTLSEFLIRLICRGFLGATLATIGFGVLFNVRGKSLAAAGLTGGAGGFAYQLCLVLGLSDPVSNFIAAVVISVIAEICARRLKNTVTTFTACALIPLVPGGTAYEMMVEFTQNNAMSGLMKLLDVLTIAGMLAMGILFVSTLTRFFYYSCRKIHGTKEKLVDVPLYVSRTVLHPSLRRHRLLRKEKLIRKSTVPSGQTGLKKRWKQAEFHSGSQTARPSSKQKAVQNSDSDRHQKKRQNRPEK